MFNVKVFFFCLIYIHLIFCLSSDCISNVYVNYDYYCCGNCENDVSTPTTFGINLVGGGDVPDEAFNWMINLSGGGDFVAIKSGSGDEYYAEHIYGLGGTNKVELFILNNLEASFELKVLESVKNAESLFFTGGDQWRYYSYFKGTPLQEAFLSVYDKIPVGGTSAGLASFGKVIFSAQFNTVYSDEALNDPYNKYMTFGVDFLNTLPFLDNTITDSHFEQRDRMGRLIGFVSRMIQDSYVTYLPSSFVKNNTIYSDYGAKGIGINEDTAILIDENGIADITTVNPDGSGSAFFIYLNELPIDCYPGSKVSMI
eukprot:TRINITY_DN749_c1_g1_i4.p1 TRINITY_DN749_c1_g1~~TRINITY_DN749_c1_g1_i4.p1  ORF type:complete len:313 (+),score=85.67 TRINITY_DN749_c1_g1_i4:45-983(+)